jgi:hypothetical protein
MQRGSMAQSRLAQVWETTVASIRRRFAAEYNNNPLVRVRTLLGSQVEITVPELLTVEFLLETCTVCYLDAEIDLSQKDAVVVRFTSKNEADNTIGVDALLARVGSVSSEEIQAVVSELGVENWAQARAILATSMLCGLDFRKANTTFHTYNPAAELVFHYTGQLKLTLRHFQYVYENWMIRTAMLVPGAVVFGILPVSDNSLSVYGQCHARMQDTTSASAEAHSRKRKRHGAWDTAGGKRAKLST